MNHTGFLTLHEYMFQISNQSVKPFSLEIGEQRDIEDQNDYHDNYILILFIYLRNYRSLITRNSQRHISYRFKLKMYVS